MARPAKDETLIPAYTFEAASGPYLRTLGTGGVNVDHRIAIINGVG